MAGEAGAEIRTPDGEPAGIGRAEAGRVEAGRGEVGGGKQHWFGRAWVVAIVLVGLLGSASVAGGAWYWHSHNRSEAQAQFRTRSEDVAGDVTKVLLQYGELLSGSAALFHQGVVSRAQYADYLQAVGFGSKRFPGLEGVGLIQRVAPGQVGPFLASLRSDGIRAQVFPPGHRASYCLGSYADWSNLDATVPLFGFDVCTVPAIARALATASRTGQQQVLPGSTLGPKHGPDFLLVQPVYAATPGPAPGRGAEVDRWVVAFTNGPGLLSAAVNHRGVQFVLYSGTGSRSEVILRSGPSVELSGSWRVTTDINAYGPWFIRSRPTAGAGSGIAGPLVLLAFGLLVVGLLVALLGSLLTSRGRAQRAVERAVRSLHSKDERFRKLVANSTDLIAVVDEEGQVVWVNPAAGRVLSPAAPGEPGVNLLDVAHPDDRERATAALAACLAGPGVQRKGVFRALTGSGECRVFEVIATNRLDDPDIAGIVVNAREITESTNLTRALNTLGQGNQVLVHASDEDALLADTSRAIVDAGGYELAWVGYAEYDDARTVRPVAAAGRTEYLDGLKVTWADDSTGRGPTGTAVRTGVAQVLEDMENSGTFTPWRGVAARAGFVTSCALPLVVGGRVIGALSIYAAERGAFGPPQVRLLSQLAEALAYGVGRIRDAQLLQASEERFRALAATAPVGIFESLAGGSVSFVNPRAAEICGTSVESLLGEGWVAAIHPDDRAGILDMLDRARESGAAIKARFRAMRPDGEVRHLRFSTAERAASLGGGRVSVIADITEEVQAQDKLAHQAFHDALTGLPNRALFLDRLEQELAWRGRTGSNIAVLFLDLDRFKLVNDSFGHDAGDAVLREVGNRVLRAVRAGETASRFSGDEFIFIIRDVHGVHDAVAAAERLLGVLASPIRCENQDVTVTGSIGIVVPGPGADAATVLRDADTAMYQAKDAGRDRYEVFDESQHHRSVARLEMEAELREALACHQFEVYYQPNLALPHRRPMGAEALIRWHHPTVGTVSPLEFIPVAEDTGLIKAIGRFVLEQAVSQLASWDALAGGPRLGVLAVNLSARQLHDEDTSFVVREVLERHGVAPNRLSLEVTESAIMGDNALTLRSLAGLKALGVGVAIDDFGTGYSSLSYLHTLPVTTVKIDRSFIERLGTDDDSTPVVRAIVDMAHAMGLLVVAEGVSQEHLGDLVSATGCDGAQGFYWSPPLPAPAFADWWRQAVQWASEPVGAS